MTERLFFLWRTADRRARRPARRHAMTLVEMLVAMALSLIIILAITQVFRLVGDNVLASRAVSEMAGQLRGTADQLRADLDGVTVPVRPWTDARSGLGYFEVYEGPFWDMGLGPDAASWFSQTSAGDFDDVLMFTTRAEGSRFRGQVLGTVSYGPAGQMIVNFIPGSPVRTVIESNVAEIAWFTRFNDWNNNGQPDPGELTLHRRVFLVLPNLDISTDGDIQRLTPGEFYHGFDVSVRYEQDQVSGNWVRYPNSLQTLSLRQNRTGHQIAGGYPVGVGSLINQTFPYPLSRALLVPQGTVITSGNAANLTEWGAPGIDDDANGVPDDITEAGQFGTNDLALPLELLASSPPVTPEDRLLIMLGESYGSDVVLSQLLAFDVKVFDPTVTVQQALALPSQATLPPTPDAVLPGDPGYQLNGTVIGQGGYVDLFYSRYVPGAPLVPPFPSSVASTFAGLPQLRSGLRRVPSNAPIFWGIPVPAAVYDTWTTFYEQDGVDQDWILGLDRDSGGNSILGADQGTNGADDLHLNLNNFPPTDVEPPINGVDDVGERETSPPYPSPLRSVQVRIRIIDPDSRQVRQVSVVSDFIPE